jgi:hypothetical protein
MQPLEISYMESKDATIVTVAYYWDEEKHFGWAGTGTSKRRPGDKANKDLGRGLALARALGDLALKLENVYKP